MKKELAIDRFIKKLISEHLFEVCLVLVLLSAALMRITLFSNTELSPDYNTYYKAWVDYYRENGGLAGLRVAPGDYYVPFNVIYALCSYLPFEPWLPLGILPCICEAVSAYFIYRIFFLLTGRKHHSAFAGILTLFLPFVVFNGSLWKQVDAVYTCFLMITLFELLRENYRRSFIWYAIAFSFKLQAILFLPVLVILYITGGYHTYDRVKKDSAEKNGFSILEFAWIPVIYLIAGLPEVLAKHGLRATYFAYFNQTQELSTEGYGMVSFFPNLYNFGFDNYDALLSKAAILLLFVVLIFIAFFCYKTRDSIDRKMVVYIAIWTAWTCVMLLPGMHERYDYAMLLILTPFAITCRKQILWPMFVANLCSLANYGKILFHVDLFPLHYVAIPYTVAYLMVTIDIIRQLRGGNTGIEA